ncbi:MAG: hypothetical protein Q9174_000699 [Haloplaca sp. 1 TL-2023]
MVKPLPLIPSGRFAVPESIKRSRPPSAENVGSAYHGPQHPVGRSRRWKNTKHPLPIFTLPTLDRRIYVVNSPDLISAVQKDAKSLSFGPFVSWMSPKIFDVGEDAMTIINENIDGAKGPHGLLPEVTRGMTTALAPGTSLDSMTQTMLGKLSEYIEPLGASDRGTDIHLYKWVRKAFTVASTEAVGGKWRPPVILVENSN